MSIEMDKLTKLNNLVATSFRRKHIIVLDPAEQQPEENLNSNIIYDEIDWKMSDETHSIVDELSKNAQLSNEDKMLIIYEKLCRDYVYDDNLLSYIQKIDDETFSLPDWYGRDIDNEWEKNREEHNRRVCYEVSRELAKALKVLFKDNEDYNVCILWDKGLTHYFVGLTCNDYSITLDMDDFNSIKDLTRIKSGLTANGIVILDDKKGKVHGALDKFNEGKSEEALKKLEHDIVYSNTEVKSTEESEQTDTLQEDDRIVFLRHAIEIFKNKYNLDSQGIYEYIKEVVDIKLGTEARKKVWKEIKGDTTKETRYIRCLILDVDNKKYLIDVDEMLIRPFDEAEFQKDDREFIPYKDLLKEELIDFRSLSDSRYSGK